MEGIYYQQQLMKGLNLYLIKDPKFKTVSINIFMYRPLDGNTTRNALLPQVLKRGCEGYPDVQSIERFLGEKYGASLEVDVIKKGDIQLLNFSSNVISNKYTLKGEGVVGDVLRFLLTLVSRPVTEGKGFKRDYVQQEVDNLRKLIQARINDKIQYSIERCFEELCKGQPFSRYKYGEVEDLEGITPENLADYYRSMLPETPIDIFIIGDADITDIEEVLENPCEIQRGDIKYPVQQKAGVIRRGPREVVERMDVNQGKLTMGYITGVDYVDRDYIPMAVYASVLGGGPHSKLFNNVRERASLAYYSFARLEKFKGLMLIGSGIEISNYHKTVDIINEQLEDMARGNISDFELEGAKKALVNDLLAMNDSQNQIADFLINKKISGHQFSPDDLIRGIKETTAEQISRVAERVQPGIIYFLTGKEQAREEEE